MPSQNETPAVAEIKHYCYYCGVHHLESEMRRVVRKTGVRWRCIKSIKAASQSKEKRAAFGRSVSEMNSRINRDVQRMNSFLRQTDALS